jgi:hypothetical protein
MSSPYGPPSSQSVAHPRSRATTWTGAFFTYSGAPCTSLPEAEHDPEMLKWWNWKDPH